jgi:large subunit ribosomal protein L4
MTTKTKSAPKKEINLEAKIYSQTGKEVKTISLPENIFGLNWNADLVHQVAVSMTFIARENIAHTKTRGEVRGGGKKPWKQKGTGRARHGSSRSPIWVGGGVALGPRKDTNYDRKINRKMKTKAIFTILSKKFADGEILFVDNFAFEKPKTADAKKVLLDLGKVSGFETLATKRKNSAYIGTANKTTNTEKSFANIGSVEVGEFRNINPLDLLNKKFLVIENPESAVNFLQSKKA